MEVVKRSLNRTENEFVFPIAIVSYQSSYVSIIPESGLLRIIGNIIQPQNLIPILLPPPLNTKIA